MGDGQHRGLVVDGRALHETQGGSLALHGHEARTGGEGGIRTHETLARPTVFKTVAFNHSATSPAARRIAAVCFRAGVSTGAMLAQP